MCKQQLQGCQTEKKVLEERVQSLQHLQERVDHYIKGVCQDSLKDAAAHLVVRSKELLGSFQQESAVRMDNQKEAVELMLKPFEKTLADMQESVQMMEKNRHGAYEGLTQQVKGLNAVQNALHGQTSQLLQALKTPNARGQWGEVQLRRLVEWSGMLPFCDFITQQNVQTDSNAIVRPDLVIRLPDNRCVVVDAKVPLHGLLDNNSSEAESNSVLAKHLKNHIRNLSRRSYQEHVPQTPDFVLLFVPVEGVLIRALEEDASLIDVCMEKNVLLATPMTLIALLKTIALGWRQHKLGENVEKIAHLAKDMTKQFEAMMGHLAVMGRGLKSTSHAYSALIDTMQSDILPASKEIGQFTGHRLQVPRFQKMPPLTPCEEMPKQPMMLHRNNKKEKAKEIVKEQVANDAQ